MRHTYIHAEWYDTHVCFRHKVKYTRPQASIIKGHINTDVTDEQMITHSPLIKKVMLARHFFTEETQTTQATVTALLQTTYIPSHYIQTP